MQKSFLDAFLKDNDREGWTIPGKLPSVSLCLRRGNPGYNKPEAERNAFPRREELEWPIARTKYVNYNLCKSMLLSEVSGPEIGHGLIIYSAPKGSVTFFTEAFVEETEITGHPMLRLSVSAHPDQGNTPSEIDIFATLRHLDSKGEEGKLFPHSHAHVEPITNGRKSLLHWGCG